MAVDMFINMGDKIKGESKDKEQSKKNDIDVLAWSWGVSQSGTTHMGSGAGAGKANFQDISFTKYLDTASTSLMMHCGLGTHIPKIVLLCRKAGEKPVKYLELTMEECIITGVSTGGSGGEDRLTENVSINFAKFKYEYFKQADKGGEATSAGEFVYDIAANSKE